MELSTKEQKDLKKLAEKSKAITKFLEDNELCQEDTGISDNWLWVFTFMYSGALVKHSKTLTGLTIGLIVLGVGMIVLAWQQANLWPFWLW